MDRITIYDTDPHTAQSSRVGWFDRDSVTLTLGEGFVLRSSNFVGQHSGIQRGYGYEELLLTSGGRWVRHVDARRYFDGGETWAFLTPDEAQAWIVGSGADEAEEILAKYFPDTPDEAGPPTASEKGGRPAVGPAVSVAYPRDLLARVDAAADQEGMTRAAWLRRAAERDLAS